MKRGNLTLLVVLGILVIFGFWGCSQYNGLVKEDENVKNAWGNVQSAYQRRADLIPNLVATVQGEANFERGTLSDVTNARARATAVNVDPSKVTPEQLAEFQAAQGQLSQALGRLLMVTENYPTLRANEGFRNLQFELAGTENRINRERDLFNGVVNTYNRKVRSFPVNMVAGMFGFAVRPPFAASAEEEGANSKEIAETIACASLLSANNVYYRFRHFMNEEFYNNSQAGIRMNIMASPVLGKELFELISIAVSAVNGCEMCVKSHEASLIELGSKEERIFEAVRLASVITSVSKVIY